MPNFKINIMGIAMIYSRLDSNVWQIIVPFDSTDPNAGDKFHNVRFTSDKPPKGSAKPIKDLVLAAAKRKIKFTAAPPVSSKFGQGDFGDFLNLTADYAHDKDSLSTVKGWDNNAVVIEVPAASLRPLVFNESKYRLINGPVGTSFEKGRGTMAYWARFEIDAKELVMQSTGQADLVYDSDTAIIFDNDCGGSTNDPHGDIQLVYNVVHTAGAKLATIRPDTAPLFGGIGNTLNAKIQQISDGIDNAAPPINLDDVNGNPKEGEGGLPCHVVVIEDPPPGLP